MLTTTRTRRLLIGSGLALAGLAGAACGSDSATTAGSGAGANAETSGASAESGDALEVTAAWARTSPSGVDTGAAYLRIKGGAQDDTLLSIEVPSTVAGVAQIHEMVPAGGGSGSAPGSSDPSMAMGSDHTTDSSGGDGAMVMQEVTGGLDIPAGRTVVLEPGGYHVMLMDLVKPLQEGDRFDLTLTFAQAGEKTVEVEVRSEAP